MEPGAAVFTSQAKRAGTAGVPPALSPAPTRPLTSKKATGTVAVPAARRSKCRRAR
jgi:hypothetical protein